MQINEHVGRVQQGRRLPHVEQAVSATRDSPEARAERRDAEPSRRQATRPLARKPARYGAGF